MPLQPPHPTTLPSTRHPLPSKFACFRFLAAALAICLGMANLAQAQANEQWRSWNQPVKPLKIIDNVYYVGASDIASYLITTEAGHIVIDGGFVETAPMIRDNIQALGFDLADVKILLNSHAHFDHSAGLAALAEWTGAEVIASKADAAVLESGGAGDYFISAEHNAFPAVTVARQVDDGEQVRLGTATLTAQVTAGHTRGCTSWSMEVDGGGGSPLTAVFICSVTLLPGVSLLDNDAYPNIVEDYRATFERFDTLPCDVFLAAHAQFFDLAEKRELVATAESNPFIDPEGCKAYLDRGEQRFEKELAKQLADRSSGAPPETSTSPGTHRH